MYLKTWLQEEPKLLIKEKGANAFEILIDVSVLGECMWENMVLMEEIVRNISSWSWVLPKALYNNIRDYEMFDSWMTN